MRVGVWGWGGGYVCGGAGVRGCGGAGVRGCGGAGVHAHCVCAGALLACRMRVYV